MTETVAITKLNRTGGVPGTDLFFEYYDAVNLPNVKALWVGRLRPTAPGEEPAYDTFEEIWLYKEREYRTLESVLAAIDDDNRAADLRDRVGEALRRGIYGLIRPLWKDYPENEREEWRERGEIFVRLLKSFGITISFTDDKS